MKNIVLPSDISISYHAAERFLERVMERDTYTSEDVEIAIQIIINILIQRVLHFKRIDQSTEKNRPDKAGFNFV